MQSIISLMFEKFPRYVGNPRQHKIETDQQLKQFMFVNSGNNNCFTSVYSTLNGKTVIDKVFNDIDNGDKEKALEIAKKLFKKYLEYGLDVVPIYSGMKGFHVYPLLKPKIYGDDVALLLKQFSYKFINEANVYEITDDGKKIPLVDTSVIGDLKRLCRYINTQRVSSSGTPISSFCIMLDPSKFLDMEINEIIELAKSPQNHLNYKINEPTLTLDDFDYSKVNLNEFKSNQVPTTTIEQINTLQIKDKNVSIKILSRLIRRPCIRNLLLTTNPPDKVRYAATCELNRIKMSPHKIVNLFAGIGWSNFDESKTLYQVEQICLKNSQTMGKKLMIQNGFCTNNEDICKNCI